MVRLLPCCWPLIIESELLAKIANRLPCLPRESLILRNKQETIQWPEAGNIRKPKVWVCKPAQCKSKSLNTAVQFLYNWHGEGLYLAKQTRDPSHDKPGSLFLCPCRKTGRILRHWSWWTRSRSFSCVLNALWEQENWLCLTYLDISWHILTYLDIQCTIWYYFAKLHINHESWMYSVILRLRRWPHG